VTLHAEELYRGHFDRLAWDDAAWRPPTPRVVQDGATTEIAVPHGAARPSRRSEDRGGARSSRAAASPTTSTALGSREGASGPWIWRRGGGRGWGPGGGLGPGPWGRWNLEVGLDLSWLTVIF
jgi:hypothetical protein